MKVCKAQTKVIRMGKVQLDSRVPIEIELRYFDYQLEVRNDCKKIHRTKKNFVFLLWDEDLLSIEIVKQIRKMADLSGGAAFGIRVVIEPSLHTVRGFCSGMRKLNATEEKK